MHKITCGGLYVAKPDYVVDTEAAAAITVGDGELVVAVGTSLLTKSPVLCVIALNDLLDALRERQFPDGAAADNYAYMTPPDKANVVVGNAAAVPALAETDAVIAYGGTFAGVGSSQIFIGHINRMIEKFLEDVAKVN